MVESYSVEAVLSAKDNGFSATFNSANKAAQSLGSRIKGGIGFGVMMAAGQTAFNAVAFSVTGMASELSSASATWKTFESNMTISGKSTATIEKVKGELQEFAQQTIYSSSDMASTYAQLAAVGTKNTTKLVKGFGGLAAAAENPSQAMKTLSQQATQMAAKPMVQWQDFKLMVEQTPAGIASVAKEMGMSTQEMIAAVQDGKIKTEDFFDAITKVGAGEQFTKMATSYKTVGEAMDGLTETMANKLQPAFEVVSQVGINAISGLADAMEGIDASGIATKIQGFVDKASGYWAIFKEDMAQVGSAFGSAVSAIAANFQELTGSFGSTESLSNFSSVMNVVTGALQTFAGFCEEHADTIAALITQLPKLALGFAAFKIVSTIAPFMTTFGNAITNIASIGLEALATKLLGLAAAETATGTASSTAGKEMLNMSAAVLAVGAGILLAATGFALLAQSAIALSSAGTGAVVCMVGMAAGVAALMAVTSALGPALTAGAVGVAVLGAGLLLVATAAVVAGAAINLVANALPTLSEYGTSGAAAIAALGASMLVFGAGATVAGAAAIVLGAGLVVAAAGVTVFGAGLLVASASVLVLKVALMAVNSSVKSIASNAKSAQSSLTSMASSVSAVKSGLQTIGDKASSAMSALKKAFTGAATDAKSAGTKAGQGFSTGLSSGLKAATTAATSASQTITSKLNATAAPAKSAGKNTGTGYVSGLKSTVTKATSVASSATRAVTARLRSGHAGAVSAGRMISAGFASGMRSCLGQIEAAAARMVAAASKAIRAKAQIHSPSRLTKKDGRYLALGLAKGMTSSIKTVQSAAKTLVGTALQTLASATKTREYKDAASSAASAYQSSINSKVTSATKSAKSAITKQVKTLKKNNPKLKKEYEKLQSVLTSKVSSAIKAEGEKAYNAANKALTALAEKYQEKYDDIKSAQDNFKSTLQDYGDLFTSDDYGHVSIANFSEQTKQVKKLAANMAKLKNVLPSGLIEDIQSLSTAQGITYTNELLKMSTSQLKQYGKDYTAFMNTGSKAASSYYASYFKSLDSSYAKEVKKVQTSLASQLNQIGKQAAAGLAKGLTNSDSLKKLSKSTKTLANTIVKQVKKSLNIHSPSRVMAALGEYAGQGFIGGIDAMREQAAKAMESFVAIPSAAVPAFAGDFGGELSEQYSYGIRAEYTINVPLSIDGKEFARATASDMALEQSKIEKRASRKKGVR